MIRKARTSDFEFIYGLYFHPEINPFLLYEHMDAPSFQPIFKELMDTGVLYVFDHEGEMAGMSKLVPLTHRTDHIVYLGGVAIHPDFAGKGLGEQMILEVLEHAKKSGFLRVELSTATINERAIRLYEKTGFQKEGVLRRFCHLKSEGRFLDEVLMSCLLD
jgi:RimJ/RimL family protein N-acetyltransferase